MKRMLILGACIGLLAGCTDVEPTGVRTAAAGGSGSSAAVDLRADALIVIDDAIERVVPALPHAQSARSIDTALAGLRRGIEQANVNALPALFAAVRSTLDRYEGGRIEDAPDLDVIGIALDYAEALLGITP